MTLRQLDQKGRKEFEVAESAEIQSPLRYEAVTAARLSEYHHREIMKMRWVLRYKGSGKPEARLVIIGYHDPRVGSDVRTEALVAFPVVEEVCSSWPPLTISFPLKREMSKTRFIRERLTTRHVVTRRRTSS